MAADGLDDDEDKVEMRDRVGLRKREALAVVFSWRIEIVV